MCNSKGTTLRIYGITKDPETKEFMMIMQFASQGNLRRFLSNNFKNILWKNKILYLRNLAYDFKNLHELGYYHKDSHSGNVLHVQNSGNSQKVIYISDFGLSGPSNKQKQMIKFVEYCHILHQKF